MPLILAGSKYPEVSNNGGVRIIGSVRICYQLTIRNNENWKFALFLFFVEKLNDLLK